MLEYLLLNSVWQCFLCVLCRHQDFPKPEPSKSLSVEYHVNDSPHLSCKMQSLRGDTVEASVLKTKQRMEKEFYRRLNRQTTKSKSKYLWVFCSRSVLKVTQWKLQMQHMK